MWGELISCSSLSSLISIGEALAQKILAFEEGLAKLLGPRALNLKKLEEECIAKPETYEERKARREDSGLW